jgi:hypothetical protein
MPPHDSTEHPDKGGVSVAVNEIILVPGQFAKPVPKKIIYPFVDLIRFISTIGIVFIHTEVTTPTGDFNIVLHRVNHVAYYLAFRQLFKFATICYFLIAGFLLADKMAGDTPFNYYIRRLNVIAKPYLFAVLLFFIALLVKEFALPAHKFGFGYFFAIIKYIVFYTPFWYIPNYLLCLLVIVCFSKYINSLYFGGFLLLITLGYTYFNVYSPANGSHTTALFGFVFYMWLGVYIKKNDLISRIKMVSPLILGFLLLLIYLLSNCESFYLFNYMHTQDSLNTLRISNQLYSVVVFIFLVRCCGKAPRFGIFNPRKETYGIYLYHAFFIFFIIPALEGWIGRQFHISFFSYNIYSILLITITNFAICYFGATALVKIMLRLKLAYLPPL